MNAAPGLAALWFAAALAGLQLIAPLAVLASRKTRHAAQARRSVRFWAAVAVAALAAAAALQLASPGRGLLLTSICGLFALALALRYPRPPAAASNLATRLNGAARLIFLAGLALALAAFAWSRLGAQQTRIAALCAGQSAQMGRWNFALGEIAPVAGGGFTALQAGLSAQRDKRPVIALTPQLRDYFAVASDAAADARAQAQVRWPVWDGELAVGFAAYDARSGCMALEASWWPLLGIAQLGSWLAALGAATMALAALASLGWRRAARQRIAMRREDRPLPRAGAARAGAASAAILPDWPLGHVLAACLVLGFAAALAWGRADVLPRSAAPVMRSFDHGPALVAARQSLIEGPANLNRWIVIGDAMARRGRFGDAAEVLLGATASAPNDPQGWLALGDALYGHAGGHLSPAAELAYERADRAVLRGGAPPLLVGLAMERSGRADLAAQWWQRRLSRAPADAPWRAAIMARLPGGPTSAIPPSP